MPSWLPVRRLRPAAWGSRFRTRGFAIVLGLPVAEVLEKFDPDFWIPDAEVERRQG